MEPINKRRRILLIAMLSWGFVIFRHHQKHPNQSLYEFVTAPPKKLFSILSWAPKMIFRFIKK